MANGLSKIFKKTNNEVLYKLTGPKDESALISEYILNELARTILNSEIKHGKKVRIIWKKLKILLDTLLMT